MTSPGTESGGVARRGEAANSFNLYSDEERAR